MNTLTRFLTVLFAAAALTFATGCEKSTGDHLEDAGDSISDAAEQAGDSMGDAVEEAGDKVEDATDDAK
ncbi:MAG: YtxH domain-containing protein [Verrucomicrobiota bacterium JB024]|nr:YtxH domain-containing protein [Verrucomicrobiota bacterium JB024]